MSKAYVSGVGMTQFVTPRTSPDYLHLGSEAVRDALQDAGVSYSDIEQVYAGYIYGDSTCGQRVAYNTGMTGVPVINVNNNCSTGSTALFLARQAIESGAAECVLAMGFEQMAPGAIGSVFNDRPSPLDLFLSVADKAVGSAETPMAIRLFGGAGREYAQKYGVKPETFAKITVKAREHARRNPKAVFRQTVTVEEVMASAPVFDPLTRLQCCPPTCGAAAAVLVSESFGQRKGLNRRVRIAAQAMATDKADAFAGSMIAAVGFGMSKSAADQVYAAAGVSPRDINVVELHDCFTANEILTYESLGLVGPGDAERFVEDRANTFGGRVVVNPSGGLLSKGHPIGATGLAQCYELVSQLRGAAGERQVENARLGLQHNIGLGGACVVTLYEAV